MRWYYTSGGQQQGPVSDEQLQQLVRQGQVTPQDLAWRDGLPQWTAIQLLPELTGPAQAAAMPVATPAGRTTQQTAPGMLQYATPTHLAAPQQTLPVIAPDNGPFLNLGGSFHSSKARWSGAVVASPVAVYMLKRAKQQTHGYGGGVVGALVAAAVDSGDDTRTCGVGELPLPVRQALDPKGKHTAKDVIIVPRDTVRRVGAPGFNNAVYLHVGTQKMTIYRGLFSGGKIRSFLSQYGWPVNQDVVPTAAPVHGEGFGRSIHTPPPKPTHPLLRVLYIIIAIIIFCAVVYFRVNSRRY